jgi:hypothetical protein
VRDASSFLDLLLAGGGQFHDRHSKEIAEIGESAEGKEPFVGGVGVRGVLQGLQPDRVLADGQTPFTPYRLANHTPPRYRRFLA